MSNFFVLYEFHNRFRNQNTWQVYLPERLTSIEMAVEYVREGNEEGCLPYYFEREYASNIKTCKIYSVSDGFDLKDRVSELQQKEVDKEVAAQYARDLAHYEELKAKLGK